MKTLILAFAILAGYSTAAFAQADSTLSRPGDLQLGVGYSIAGSDYIQNDIRGFAFYGDFDFRANWGVEVDFHQASDPQTSQVYERTYEIGGRYLRNYGIFKPYAKLLVGRGVFNYPDSQANLAYNMGTLGGGVDIRVHPRVNVRFDYEYQHWLGFQPNGLTPQVVTIGVAYHFDSGRLGTQE